MCCPQRHGVHKNFLCRLSVRVEEVMAEKDNTSMIRKILYQPFFIKLFNWEYWPFHFVYGPIYLYWFWLCARARSFFFFNTFQSYYHQRRVFDGIEKRNI